MKVLDLFSGIGGFALAGESLGFETVSFCEIEPFPRKVLNKHWPDIPVFEDITKITERDLDGIGTVNIICGGFPCQDISIAGKGAGLEGERSGLFFEIMRLVRMVRPKYIFLENVPALLYRGMGTVLAELAKEGYDAEWDTISCGEIGGTHKRERVWILAYANGERHGGRSYKECGVQERKLLKSEQERGTLRGETSRCCGGVSSNTNKKRIQRGQKTGDIAEGRENTDKQPVRLDQPFTDPDSIREPQPERCKQELRERTCNSVSRQTQSGICRKDDGIPRELDGYLLTKEQLPDALQIATITEKIPHRNDRLKALGNSIVPQVAQIIFKKILAREGKQYDISRINRE